MDRFSQLVNEIALLKRKLMYSGIFFGNVVENEDPKKKGRIKAKVISTHGENFTTEWAIPFSLFAGNNYGFYFVPEIGDRVAIQFINGDVNKPVYTGSFWDTDAENSPQEIPAEGSTVERKVIKTKGGHFLKFDDSEDSPEIEIQHQNGSKVVVKKDKIVIEDATNKTSIISKSISLGSLDKSKEPMVLGDTLVALLKEILGWLKTHSHPQASPAVQVPQLTPIENKVKDILSKVGSID